jgi:bla regulator protein blaR1
MIIYQWISNEFAPAFSRMLLHSLWIGVIASLVAVLIIVLTKKAPAATRYNWLTLLFVATISTTVISFFRELGPTTLEHRERASFLTSVSVSTNVVDYRAQTGYVALPEKNMVSELISFLDNNSILIVFLWFLLFVFHLIKMVLGIRYIHILRHHKVHEPNQQWVTWVRQKSQELGIQKMVVFFESELIKIPTAVGHLKPMILIPIGLLSQLSPQEVESILVHELAHISRRDYLVNLLQNFVQAIFFFNPAFLWLSYLIRQEREKCCDDIAVQHSSRKDYLNALLSFQDSAYTSNYAMALGGPNYSLLNRVKRIINNENNKPGKGEVCLLLLAMIITAVSLSAFKSQGDHAEKVLRGRELVQENGHELNSKVLENQKSAVRPLQLSQQSPASKSAGLITSENVLNSRIDKTTFQVQKTDEMEKKPSTLSDTGGIAFDRYTNITIKPISEKGPEYRIIEASNRAGVKYHIEAVQNSIQKLVINGKEIGKDKLEYYRDLVEHIDYNFRLLERKMPADMKQKFFKGAEVAFYYRSKQFEAMKDFNEMISKGAADSALFRQHIAQIQEQGRRKIAEATIN